MQKILIKIRRKYLGSKLRNLKNYFFLAKFTSNWKIYLNNDKGKSHTQGNFNKSVFCDASPIKLLPKNWCSHSVKREGEKINILKWQFAL